MAKQCLLHTGHSSELSSIQMNLYKHLATCSLGTLARLKFKLGSVLILDSDLNNGTKLNRETKTHMSKCLCGEMAALCLLARRLPGLAGSYSSVINIPEQSPNWQASVGLLM